MVTTHNHTFHLYPCPLTTGRGQCRHPIHFWRSTRLIPLEPRHGSSTPGTITAGQIVLFHRAACPIRDGCGGCGESGAMETTPHRCFCGLCRGRLCFAARAGAAGHAVRTTQMTAKLTDLVIVVCSMSVSSSTDVFPSGGPNGELAAVSRVIDTGHSSLLSTATRVVAGMHPTLIPTGDGFIFACQHRRYDLHVT